MEQKLIDVANKVIEKANKSYSESVKKEDYSEANSRQGYLYGLKGCLEHFAHNRNIKKGLDCANLNLGGYIRESRWGNAAYWNAYVNGFEVMRIIVEDKDEEEY
jgi:hypothetical protein